MTTPHYQDDMATLYHGDCLDVLAQLPDASIDAIVTDPPYGIGFMGKDWDQPRSGFGSRVRRHKGARSLKAGPTGVDSRRTTERGAAMEAGRYDLSPHAMLNFQHWVEAWATECLRVLKPGGHMLAFGGSRTWHRLASGIEDAGFEIRDSIAWLYGQGMPKSPKIGRLIAELPDGDPLAAEAWKGFSAQLRPSFEPIVMARKPLDKLLVNTVLTHGTGALNIDGCRFGGPSTSAKLREAAREAARRGIAWGTAGIASSAASSAHWAETEADTLGRWPANAVLDTSQAAALDSEAGVRNSGYGDKGFASRFFPIFRYEPKAPTSERPKVGGVQHPTVKPLNLMHWLVRLITPPGGIVLDPFAGSGTTLEAALTEGVRTIGIEREADYLPLILSRITRPHQVPLDLDGGAA